MQGRAKEIGVHQQNLYPKTFFIFTGRNKRVPCSVLESFFLIMLNRRTLRIKVMQSLFAFEQCREANHELAKENLADYFTPNLNSMEVQDKATLKQEKEAALKTFEQKFENPDASVDQPAKIVQLVEQELAQYRNSVKRDFDFFRKSTLLDIENLSGTYYLILNLFTALASVAAADKKNAFVNISKNPFIQAIANSAELKTESGKTGGHWDNRMDKVRGWFKDIVKGDPDFIEYSSLSEPTADQHHDVLKHVLRKLFIQQTAIASFFEEQDMHWAEDKEVLKSMVEKSLKSIKSNGTLELQKLSLEWDDDKIFVEQLFEAAAWLPEKHKALIGQHTVNWEVDRLPLTDRVVLQLAIAELTKFPAIPVKVTINEYIELTKAYSTPKSKQFINGILDVISKALKNSGEMKKSGRGLIDNK
jgi:transcription antitermination protein NusB